jgi:hypothetical protein
VTLLCGAKLTARSRLTWLPEKLVPERGSAEMALRGRKRATGRASRDVDNFLEARGFLSGRGHESYGNAFLTFSKFIHPGDLSMVFIILRAIRRVRHHYRQAHPLAVHLALRDKIDATLGDIFRCSQFLKWPILAIQWADPQRLLHPCAPAPTVLDLACVIHELI